MNTFRFIRTNARWLLVGLVLTIFSSFGQTFFIAQFSSEIRQEFSLSHGQFGGIYMLGTLASALTLVWLGRVVDDYKMRTVAVAICCALAVACLSMSLVSTTALLVVVIYGLRLFGQGMMTHTAITIMGRWYTKERGRAVAITSMGHQLGEACLPIVVVGGIGLFGWRSTWAVASAILLLVALPLLLILMRTERVRQSMLPGHAENSDLVRHWTRVEVINDHMFWMICTVVLIPSFIGTSFLFHQVHIGELKSWSRASIASSFAVMSLTTVTVSMIAGSLVDRFSARRLLPVFLIPLGSGCLVLSFFDHPITIYVFMVLLGSSYGFSIVIFGALWPEVYGTRHLGAIRSLAMAAMVLASAIGPGLTGYLIDAGIGFELQLVFMGLYCLFSAAFLLPVSRRLLERNSIQVN